MDFFIFEGCFSFFPEIPLAVIVSVWVTQTHLGLERFTQLSGREPVEVVWGGEASQLRERESNIFLLTFHSRVVTGSPTPL